MRLRPWFLGGGLLGAVGLYLWSRRGRGGIVSGYGELRWSDILNGSGYAAAADVPPTVQSRVRWAVAHVYGPVRAAWGRPLRVVAGGGLRTAAMNEAIYAARGEPPTRSRHVQGDAFDLAPVDAKPGDVYRLYVMADRLQTEGALPAGGLAIYLRANGQERFIHVDGREVKARWNAEYLAAVRKKYPTVA